MKFRKFSFIVLIQLAIILLGFLLSLLILNLSGLIGKDAIYYQLKILSFVNIKLSERLLRWTIWFYVFFMLISNVVVTHKFASGKTQETLFLLSSELVIATFITYLLYSMIKCKFQFKDLDWLGFLDEIIYLDPMYYGLLLLVFIALLAAYIFLIDRRFILYFGAGLRGEGKLHTVKSNLENSRWLNREEKQKLFKTWKYSGLDKCKKDGIPVGAELTYKNKDMDIRFNSPCHALVIGSTGSGKTTTFVSPMIQILGATKAGSSMVVTDPKGELFSMHSKFLKDRGYDVQVLDLRDTYSSSRWNPLDSIYDQYTKYRTAHQEVYKRTDKPQDSGLKLMDPIESFENSWFEFNGQGYAKYEHLITAIKLFKKKIFDEVYEDLNDLVSVLVPVENEKDPMWEKGARSITLAVLLAMLEDSEDPRFGMTKDKFTFFNLAKILQNSSEDYKDLRNYFKGRNPLSKALALSKQVCDAATQTRASYMSIVYEKLTLFNDAGICALTSESDISSEALAYKPTALFLKIPDEKDTRHNLAAIFILNIYKALIKVASSKPDLTLDRNVYFIMDEFGNMPKIEKFDKFITVGRSRKIWFTMIVQSYAQLNNVYGETVADIVKGNCGIKMFIGSNDMATCKEYSELCGNITVVTTTTSGNISNTNEANITSSTQVRPLIYPSELQRLNHPGDIGHSIIVTFGNYPLKTYFSPQFKVPFYKIGQMDTSSFKERFFDENTKFYNILVRNGIIIGTNDLDKETKKEVKEAIKEDKKEKKELKRSGEINLNDEEAIMDELKKWQQKHKNKSLLDMIKNITGTNKPKKVNED